jgi:hypothetical protein
MMKIAVYQINAERDDNGVMFVGLNNLERFQGTAEIDSELYDKIFEGSVQCGTLEDVYRMFNIEHPADYRGRSLSVSDVVEIKDEDGNSTFHFCDSVGFREIRFDPSLADSPKEEKIKVVLCEPGKTARVAEIGNTLEELQAAVKGRIEAFYPFPEPVCIICNEEGKLNGMRPNRAVYGEDKTMLDIIYGPFFICDCQGDNFASLNPEQLDRFKKQFQNPERLIQMNGAILSVPYKPEKAQER